MIEEAFEELKKLVGKTVKEVRVNLLDEQDGGFDLVFDDGTVLELYDIRCSKLDEDCKKKEVEVYITDYEGKIVDSQKTADLEVGGGLSFVIGHIDDEDWFGINDDGN